MKYLGLTVTTWIAIGILSMIAACMIGIYSLLLNKTQQEEAARQQFYAQQQQKAKEARDLYNKEQENINKSPPFKLLRN
jgi:DNA-binding protein H-NS